MSNDNMTMTITEEPTASTSVVKVAANRRNALRSTGPTSEAGKAVVARNTVRHGLLTNAPVVPGLEREEDWLAHRDSTLQSLAPAGHLELVLAERVALLLWRLGRVATYERAAAAAHHARAEQD